MYCNCINMFTYVYELFVIWFVNPNCYFVKLNNIRIDFMAIHASSKSEPSFSRRLQLQNHARLREVTRDSKMKTTQFQLGLHNKNNYVHTLQPWSEIWAHPPRYAFIDVCKLCPPFFTWNKGKSCKRVLFKEHSLFHYLPLFPSSLSQKLCKGWCSQAGVAIRPGARAKDKKCVSHWDSMKCLFPISYNLTVINQTHENERNPDQHSPEKCPVYWRFHAFGLLYERLLSIISPNKWLLLTVRAIVRAKNCCFPARDSNIWQIKVLVSYLRRWLNPN